MLSRLAVLLTAPMAGACATQTITATLQKVQPTPVEPARIDNSPQAVYGAIASGALGCWFAVAGQLKASHIFHADADSPAKGGAVEIAVHERDIAGAKPWGARAFKVALKPSGAQTTIEVENIKMAEAVAVQMRADVFHWAQGGKNCQLKPIEVAIAPVAREKPKKKVVAKPVAAKPVTATLPQP